MSLIHFQELSTCGLLVLVHSICRGELRMLNRNGVGQLVCRQISWRGSEMRSENLELILCAVLSLEGIFVIFFVGMFTLGIVEACNGG